MAKTIVIGCDHGGPELKNEIADYLRGKGFAVIDCGIEPGEKVDYPVMAYKVTKYITKGEADLGILICGTGIGMSMAANKVKGIRAAACSEVYSAKFTRLHNNANVLCFGARVIGPETAKMLVDAFVDTDFEGGRHERRVNLITAIENGEEI